MNPGRQVDTSNAADALTALPFSFVMTEAQQRPQRRRIHQRRRFGPNVSTYDDVHYAWDNDQTYDQHQSAHRAQALWARAQVVKLRKQNRHPKVANPSVDSCSA